MKFRQVYCVVDQDLRILWVGGEWDEFALERAGQAVLANKVLSTPLDRHITGEAPLRANLAMIETVRSCQNELRIDYRCDSPTVMRRFQMTLKPMKSDRVLMVHDLRDAQSFAHPLSAWRYGSNAADAKCSFCCAVQRPGAAWQAPEDLTEPHPETVRYDLCPDCESRISAAIEDTRHGRISGAPVVRGFGPNGDQGGGR